MLCKAMKENPDLRHLINSKNVVGDWIKTQPYLQNQKYLAEEGMTGLEIASWEKSEQEVPITTLVEDALNE